MPRHAVTHKKVSRRHRLAGKPAHARKAARARKHSTPETAAPKPEAKEPRLVGFVEIDMVRTPEYPGEFEEEALAETPENSFLMEEEED
jgi:hypothetical protein